ncbi:class IV adenylate cyclase [Sediminibacterium soli]|uniref:class IV adenylate cyclase n=1 Tax=Sediminibacterium soli TaxID=2698829 RepID=UPI00137A11BC|nr:class IV adenylate cyclase [Sediminibacterium soli]NCI46070.1 class IV adenylate cyclase [Sediminibacterium soli]
MSHINIEIKAKCFHPEKVEAFLLANGARFAGLDHQKDTYFHVPAGRLKLRQGNIENSLIFYNRPNQSGPKQSDFLLAKIGDGQAQQALLAKALGIKVIVEKHRKIFFIDNIKFHIDEVPCLGAFVEIEAGNLQDPSLTVEQLHAQCAQYMQAFGIGEADLVENSYSDMLLNGDRP